MGAARKSKTPQERVNCTPIIGHHKNWGFCMDKRKRWTIEEKISGIVLYESGKFSFLEVANRIGIDKKSVIKWWKLYQMHGVEALMPRNSCTVYEPSFKLEVLKYRVETGASYLNTATYFNLPSPYTIQRWEEKYNRLGEVAFVSRKEEKSTMEKKGQAEKDEIKEIKGELERLRMENAYLKKLNALVQDKEKSPNKTK